MSNPQKIIAIGLLCISFMTIQQPSKYAYANNEKEAMTARQLLDNLFAAISRLKTAQYEVQLKERMIDGWHTGSGLVKVQVSPLRIYVRDVKGKTKGPEVVYEAGKRGNKVLVKPNKFPYVNFTFGVTSKWLTDGQHHRVTEHDAFRSFRHAFKDLLQEAEVNGQFDTQFSYDGQTNFKGEGCHILSYHKPDYTYENYVVKEGESLFDIADKLVIAPYKILEQNKDIDSYTGVEAGDTILLPNAYTQNFKLYIHAHTFLPVMVEMSDEKGLFEHYEFLNIVVNPVLTDKDFEVGQ